MRKLAEVEEAKAVMNAAREWSVMKWLTEKKKVRKAADQANNALWAAQKEIKGRWSEELRAAYTQLSAEADGGAKADAGLKALAKRIKQADDEADRAHQDAEDTFAKAEKILSTSMAREGCAKAIKSWELYEVAIDKAEAAVETSKSAS